MCNDRVISDTHTSSTSGNRTFLPTYTSQPSLGYPPTNSSNNARHNTSRNQYDLEDTSVVGDFELVPSVNFDDFHASINPSSAYDHHIVDQPTSLSGNVFHARTGTQDSGMGYGQGERVDRGRNPSISTASVTSSKADDKAERDPSRSLARRLSSARRQPSQTSNSMPPPNAQFAVRSRRQSTLPTSNSASSISNTSSRPPRKSVGPGAYTTNYSSGRTSEDTGRSSAGTFTSQGAMSRTSSISRQRRGTVQPQPPTQPEGPKLATTARALKAKSMQPSSEQAQQARQYLSATSGTPSGTGSPALVAAKSPAKSPGPTSSTPTSSSSKRQSMHMGGLGARTISPTDTRRLKRLSQMPPGLPSPGTPTTPQPDPFSSSRMQGAPSPAPAMPSRKSATPSSARATPDASRKQSIPTLPNVSLPNVGLPTTSSFSSLRSQPGPPSNNRNSQILTGSRLPAPKPRNVQSSAGFVDEDVPPVPAIPRAYDSPKDLIDKPFFSDSMPLPASAHNPRFPNLEYNFSNSISTDSTQASNSQTSDLEVKPVDSKSTERAFAPGQNQRHRRGLTVGTNTEPDRGQVAPNAKRSTMQPMRLPPLNLLPLSTPTTNRIANFPAPSAEVEQRANASTPANRISTKTPSTPMTASKATFSRSMRDDEEYSAFNVRSQSSHFHLKSDGTPFSTRPDGSPEMTTSMPTQNVGGRSMPTPFSSGSLPKEIGDFQYYSDSAPSSGPQSARTEHAPDFGASLNFQTTQGSTLQSQQALKQPKQPPAPAHSMAVEEPETPSSTGTSLRRKLSLGWRRSNSKASKAREGEEAKNAQKSEMPPPKLPASATQHNNAITGSPVPSTHSAGTASARPSVDSRRRKSSVNTLRSSIDVQGRSSGEAAFTPKGPQKSQTDPAAYGNQAQAGPRTQSRSSSNLLTPMQKMLGSRTSLSTLKARNLDTNLDKEDLAADKIMEKLASKRKDFESAARDVDELRKRAHPKERVNPAQALQMVHLNIFEKGEIIDYREIYFCGTKNAKKHIGDLSATPNASSHQNFGYDDDRGDYNIVLGDHLAYRYEVVDMLGKGSFGQVVRCVDHKTGGLCAVKIIRNKKRFHQQALVEVNILQKLREWVSQISPSARF